MNTFLSIILVLIVVPLLLSAVFLLAVTWGMIISLIIGWWKGVL